MEISIDLGTVPQFREHCARLDNEDLKNLNVRKYPVLCAFIDKMGRLSADAQKLQRVLTSCSKIIEDPNQVLYVLWEPGHKPNQSFVVGFLKIGRRSLYLYDDKMKCHQENPICLLDFYVHYGLQRKGYGKILYDVMLKSENTMPHMIAIDKPSDNLLFFLKKHYGLTNPCWQCTNYVVYPKFFEAKTMENGKNGVNNSFSSPVKPTVEENPNFFGAASSEIGPKILAGGGDFVDFQLLSPTNKNQSAFPANQNRPPLLANQNQSIFPLAYQNHPPASPTNQNQPAFPANQNQSAFSTNQNQSAFSANQNQSIFPVANQNQSSPPPRGSSSIGSATPLSTNGSLPASTNSGASQQALASCQVSQVNSNAAPNAANSLAKERKLMSMGHHKLW